MTFKRLRRAAALVLAALALCLTVCPVYAWEDDEIVGNNGHLLKTTGLGPATSSGCTLGYAAADAVRTAAGANIAIVCGGDLYRNILAGTCTWEDIRTAFNGEPEIGIATVTAAELFELLEHSFSYAVLVEDTYDLDYEASSFYGFPQISGFYVEYDMSGHPGDRVYFVQLSDGTRLYADSDITLTLAASMEMLSGGYGYPDLSPTALGITEPEAMALYISEDGITDDFDDSDRIIPLSTTDNSFIARYPLVIALLIVILAIVATAPLTKWRIDKRRAALNEAEMEEARKTMHSDTSGDSGKDTEEPSGTEEASGAEEAPEAEASSETEESSET